MRLNDEVVLLVECESLLVVALNVEDHAGDVSCKHAFLNGLLKKLTSNTVASVWLEHRDSHDVALLGAVVEDVFLAGDSADEDVLDVGEL